ncbi:beta-1,3-galactosyltransferase 5-like [Haliotis rufescens]|uniref:beta-1,3-galactosyltransferase 5-like n=1 Tax=Haliotis rufescens TaxID=6454 RepID=UPI001EB0AC03|nr:beta-1,3-galactosyltransferase 5-like [Haliotis rufescens]XP_048239425.1 beta-1,3-galactosyltransferase 5-like [Haliotis rufescens]
MSFTFFMERCFVCILSIHICFLIVMFTALGNHKAGHEVCVSANICGPLKGIINTNVVKEHRHKRLQRIDDPLLEVVLENTQLCRGVSEVDVVFIVHSSADHYHRRQILRTIFQKEKTYQNYTLRHVFLLGQRNDVKIQGHINQEFRQNGDIVQGGFLDTYGNLTYKAVFGIKWISHNCRNVKYVIKIDDDVYTDIYNFFTHVYHSHKDDTRILCWASNMPYVVIRRTGKWKVPKFVFRHYQSFPVDYCSGFGVIIPGKIIPALYKVVFMVPFLWIDDVFLYGMARGFITGLQDLGDAHYKVGEEEVSTCFKKQSTCELIFSLIYPNRILPTWRHRQRYLQNIKKL